MMLNLPLKIILAIEDEAERRHLKNRLEQESFIVFEAGNGKDAKNLLIQELPDLLLIDTLLPDCDGLAILEITKKMKSDINVIFITEKGMDKPARMVLKKGAHDYIERPVEIEDLLKKIRLVQRKGLLKDKALIIGNSPLTKEALDTIALIAPTQITVLITGESGTGKELIARAIHELSSRNNGPFVAVNCGALAEGVLESELFGHEKGAFTSAIETRKGRFELASGGTLLLDEIGEMPLSTQVKLLRVLEERSFLRVGGSKEIKVDVRVLAATNKNLEVEVEEGNFRKDLFYRLKIVTIVVPPLRKRSDDIPVLFNHFANNCAKENNLNFGGIDDEALDVLKNYSWPGNVRELKNLAENLVVFHSSRKLSVSNLPEFLFERPAENPHIPMVFQRKRDDLEREIIYKTLLSIKEDINELKNILVRKFGYDTTVLLPLKDNFQEQNESDVIKPSEHVKPIADIEKDMVIKALNQFNWNKKKAAHALGIGERTLYRKIKEYGL